MFAKFALGCALSLGLAVGIGFAAEKFSQADSRTEVAECCSATQECCGLGLPCCNR